MSWSSLLEPCPVWGNDDGSYDSLKSWDESMDFTKNKRGQKNPNQRERERRGMITHKYRGSQQFSRVEYSTQIYWFDTRGAEECSQVLTFVSPRTWSPLRRLCKDLILTWAKWRCQSHPTSTLGRRRPNILEGENLVEKIDKSGFGEVKTLTSDVPDNPQV